MKRYLIIVVNVLWYFVIAQTLYDVCILKQVTFGNGFFLGASFILVLFEILILTFTKKRTLDD